jgi:2-keto-4-pentenoate hydratase
MIDDAVRLFVAARRSFTRIAALPDAAKPASLAEAHAVQDATARALGEDIAGWKVAIAADGGVMRGAILRSRLLAGPAVMRAREVPLLGVEAEIAFQFLRDLPPREAEYSGGEVAEAVTALVGIEVVDSRFLDYAATPLLDRTADCMSNGAFVVGMRRADWRSFDLAQLEATLRVNDAVVVRQRGGHAAGDPILPAVRLVNALRGEAGVQAGQIITTGSYTGLYFAKPGDRVAAEFDGFGAAEIRFEAA